MSGTWAPGKIIELGYHEDLLDNVDGTELLNTDFSSQPKAELLSTC